MFRDQIIQRNHFLALSLQISDITKVFFILKPLQHLFVHANIEQKPISVCRSGTKSPALVAMQLSPYEPPWLNIRMGNQRSIDLNRFSFFGCFIQLFDPVYHFQHLNTDFNHSSPPLSPTRPSSLATLDNLRYLLTGFFWNAMKRYLVVLTLFTLLLSTATAYASARDKYKTTVDSLKKTPRRRSRDSRPCHLSRCGLLWHLQGVEASAPHLTNHSTRHVS